MNDKERRAAYKIQNVEELSIEQLKYVLLTTDGRGFSFKTQALEELLKRVKEQGDVDESGNTSL